MKKNSIAKKTLGSGGHFDILHEGANARNGSFSTLRFATVRERERRVCLVVKTIYFNITKLLRPGNSQWCAKPLQIDQIYHFELQLISSLRIRFSERREGKRERQVMPPLVLLIKFVRYF